MSTQTIVTWGLPPAPNVMTWPYALSWRIFFTESGSLIAMTEPSR